jgi:hypothetical protein
MGKAVIVGFGRQRAQVARLSKRVMAELGIDVEVTIRRHRASREDLHGFAYYFNDKHGLLVFKSCPNEMLDEVVAHELVHIKQTLDGRLEFDPERQEFKWLGELWDQKRLDEVKYTERPWEAEAYSLGKILAK